MTKALQTKLLPQYREPEDVMARFLLAAHDEADPEIARTEYLKGERSVRATELQLDAFDYFYKHDAKLKDEFFGDLAKLIGKPKADSFCGVLADAWYDGFTRRTGPELLPIRASVEAYLKLAVGRPTTEDETAALLSPNEVGQVLTLTWRLLDTTVEDWIDQHKRGSEYASGDVFFRRGIVLEKLFEDGHDYKEPAVFTSWSLSVTLAEQFANTNKPGTRSAIVNADFYLFRHRVLFFSPFVPGMKSHQLEAGVIAAPEPQRLSFTGVYRGIGEYLLDYPDELLER